MHKPVCNRLYVTLERSQNNLHVSHKRELNVIVWINKIPDLSRRSNDIEQKMITLQTEMSIPASKVTISRPLLRSLSEVKPYGRGILEM